MTRPVILTIAGSDPSGGAGIQADLRTIHALGGIGVSVITAITAQNTLGVQSVYNIPADILEAQITSILSDIHVKAVKIGMLGGAEQVRVVATALRKFGPKNVVLDPVMISTSGKALLDEPGRAALVSELLPLCDLVTPNLAEAAYLAGCASVTLENRQEVVKLILGMGVRAVLIKGGHLDGEPSDLLVTKHATVELAGPRIDTPHSHGTGCFLSSAIATYLGKGYSMQEAVRRAKLKMTEALKNPVVNGEGIGYPELPS